LKKEKKLVSSQTLFKHSLYVVVIQHSDV
jgi:hypothetical protein